MPWHIVPNSASCPAGKKWAVVLNETGKVVGCHPTKAKAEAHLAALYANVKGVEMGKKTQEFVEPTPVATVAPVSRTTPVTTNGTTTTSTPVSADVEAAGAGAKRSFPKESLYRAIWPTDLELRSDSGFPGPVMFGHFAVFDEWTRIDSLFEGEFMERLVRGSFEKTFRENRSSIRALFQHGRDSYIGSKVLGPVEELREEERGAYYEVPLLETAYNRELLPGLERGLYGASFRFRVMREEIVEKPKRSDHNPDGLPERSIKEVELHEFGPVTFPAYDGATAGIRSLTDEFVLQPYTRDRQRLRELLRYLEGEPAEDDADEASEPATSSDRDAARGSDPSTSRKVRDYLDPKEAGPSWIL